MQVCLLFALTARPPSGAASRLSRWRGRGASVRARRRGRV